MSARLTVVLDDEELYRRLKVKAAQDGVPMKDLVEAGLRHVVDGPMRAESAGKPFDWERFEAMQEEWKEEDRRLGIEKAEYPTDLSDIKHYLYGFPKAAERRPLRVAEERAPYDAE